MTESVGQADLADSLDGGSLDGGSLQGDTSDRGSAVGLPLTDAGLDQHEVAAEDRVRVRVAVGPLVAPVLWRVLSMMLARAEWPLQRLDDALLVCDALSTHALAHTGDAAITFSIQASQDEAELRVLDLAEGGAAGLVQDAMLPVVGNVLERIAERVSIECGACGEGSELVLVLRARPS